MASKCQEYVNLPSSHKMPLIGYGTFLAKEEEQLKIALREAIDAGYRHIDTAFVYGNEKIIGDILQEYFKSGALKREDIFITTKLWTTFMSTKELIKKGIENSLKSLKLDYVDLYLVHCPIAFAPLQNEMIPTEKNGFPKMAHPNLVETVWRGMENLVDAGLTRSIGVSNFNSQQIDRIYKVAKHPISNNQIELNVLFQQNQLVEFCHERKITVTAYAPLGAPGRTNRDTDPDSFPLDNRIVKQIAEKYGKTSAQILLRFIMDRKICVIPKSVTPNRIKENFNVFNFKLTTSDRDKLKSLDRNLRMFKMNFVKGLGDHPEFPFHIGF